MGQSKWLIVSIEKNKKIKTSKVAHLMNKKGKKL
jgi:hypothetical protein